MMNDLQELTRQGKNICPKCDKPKQMYYNPWCPRCEKPEFNSLKTLNFMQCMYHLEALGHDGIKDRMWDHFYEADVMLGNDTYFSFYALPENPDVEKYGEQVIKDFELIQNTFNIKTEEHILFFISW